MRYEEDSTKCRHQRLLETDLSYDEMSRRRDELAYKCFKRKPYDIGANNEVIFGGNKRRISVTNSCS